MEFPSRTPCKPEVEPAPQPPVRKKKSSGVDSSDSFRLRARSRTRRRTPPHPCADSSDSLQDSAREAEPEVQPPSPPPKKLHHLAPRTRTSPLTKCRSVDSSDPLRLRIQAHSPLRSRARTSLPLHTRSPVGSRTRSRTRSPTSLGPPLPKTGAQITCSPFHPAKSRSRRTCSRTCPSHRN